MESNDVLLTEETLPSVEEAPTPPAVPSEPSDSSESSELLSLREELAQLREQLAQKKQEQQRIMEEMSEFSRLFPQVSVQDVPDPVWRDVQTGIPLSAAYALYEKRNRMDALHAEEINRRNAARSAGKAGVYTTNEYFSPDEVRSMSPSEVRENYKKIRESMKKWH